MSFYIIQDNFLLRGYKGLPFALVYPNRITADFFNKEQYSLVLDCDGNTDIDVNALSPVKKELFDRLLKLKIIRECNKGEKLKLIQEYILCLRKERSFFVRFYLVNIYFLLYIRAYE